MSDQDGRETRLDSGGAEFGYFRFQFGVDLIADGAAIQDACRHDYSRG
jgi:hypothetical protein